MRRRAALLARIRAFFAARGVLEVETPQLAACPVPDRYQQSLSCSVEAPGAPPRMYLQTSPEYAMKRLLAAGSGPIYQLAKAFRDGEAGRLHNPEFTLLEWYRLGFDHHALMDEVGELLSEVLGCDPAEKLSYAAACERWLEVDPHRVGAAELARLAAARGWVVVGLEDADRDTWLDLLITRYVEPELGRGQPTLLYDYPASQAALARIRPGAPPLASRFEVYLEGVELANGFHELADAAEQRQRFELELERRRQLGLPEVPLDERFLAALEAGLPDCAGVALGIDRLAMLDAGASHLGEVMALPVDRA